MTSQVDDTLLGVGSEAMNAATEVYGYVKAAARKTPGLKPVATQLGERFKKARAGGAAAAATTAKQDGLPFRLLRVGRARTGIRRGEFRPWPASEGLAGLRPRHWELVG